MSLFHKCLAVHIFHATPIPPKVRSAARYMLEAVLVAALFSVLVVMLIIVGGA